MHNESQSISAHVVGNYFEDSPLAPNHMHTRTFSLLLFYYFMGNRFFVHEIRTSYGEEIAWVFAFNRHFLLHLIFPALLGLLITVIEIIYMLVRLHIHFFSFWNSLLAKTWH